MKRLAWLPLLALGPVTGLLVALAVGAFRRRRPIIGLSCLAGVALFWAGAPAVLAAELSVIVHR